MTYQDEPIAAVLVLMLLCLMAGLPQFVTPESPAPTICWQVPMLSPGERPRDTNIQYKERCRETEKHH